MTLPYAAGRWYLKKRSSAAGTAGRPGGLVAAIAPAGSATSRTASKAPSRVLTAVDSTGGPIAPPPRDDGSVTRAVLFDFYGTLARAESWGPTHEDVFAEHGYEVDQAARDAW